MAKKKSYVSFVLDETGSMDHVRYHVISAYNEFVDGLKKEDPDIRFTLTQFNSQNTRVVHDSIKIEKVPQLTDETYQPNHMTPLMDAIGITIRAMEKKLEGKRPRKVLIVIQTDGEENSSKEFTREDIFRLREEKEKDGWTFVFLGADIDAYQASASIGISEGNTMSYTRDETRYAIGGQTLNSSTSYLRSKGSGGTRSFFDEDDDIPS